MPKNLLNSMPNINADKSHSIDQSAKHSQSMLKLEPATQQLQAYSNGSYQGPTMSGMKSAHHSASHSALQPHHHDILGSMTGTHSGVHTQNSSSMTLNT